MSDAGTPTVKFDDDNILDFDFADDEIGTEDASENFTDASEETETEEKDSAVDEYGTEIDLESLQEDDEHREESYSVVTAQDDFIDNNGDIVVMDNDNPEDEKRFESTLVPIDRISIAADRIRKAPSYEALYKSVKSTGLLEPLIVAPTRTEGYYVLLHGYRRLQACAKCGMTKIPCIINNRVKTAEIPILEALYNQHTTYKMKEIVSYIDYLEKEKNIMNASLIEYLTQLNNGDYNKLKDILEDGDVDIADKLLNDEMSIAQAFKALETKRKKQSKEEKENQKANKVYAGTDDPESEASENGIGLVAGSGETVDGPSLTDEQVKSVWLDPTKLDDGLEDESLDEMVAEGKEMEGFEPHKQDWRSRERIDPAIRKAVMSRDNNTCRCCKRGGPDYVDILDLHHIVEVFLGGEDSVENSVALCLNCHKQVHMYAYGQLHIPKTKTEEELKLGAEQAVLAENAQREKDGLPKMTEKEENDFKESYRVIYQEEQNKYKRIVRLGNKIREGMQQAGMNAERAKKEHPIDKIGRQKPGEKNQRG